MARGADIKPGIPPDAEGIKAEAAGFGLELEEWARLNLANLRVSKAVLDQIISERRCKPPRGGR